MARVNVLFFIFSALATFSGLAARQYLQGHVPACTRPFSEADLKYAQELIGKRRDSIPPKLRASQEQMSAIELRLDAIKSALTEANSLKAKYAEVAQLVEQAKQTYEARLSPKRLNLLANLESQIATQCAKGRVK